MEFLNNKKTYVIIVIASVVVLGTIGAYIIKTHNTNEEIDDYEIESKMEDEENIKKEIMVHVSGNVNKPGIVILEEGDRVVDAIEEAGGVTDKADLNKLNLAQTINDGEKIYVPSTEDEISLSDPNAENKQININSATEEELSKLDGIGSSIAKRIIEYRKQNKFTNIEELKNIPGIGDSKYEGIREKVTI